jgi:hypothetical protein
LDPVPPSSGAGASSEVRASSGAGASSKAGASFGAGSGTFISSNDPRIWVLPEPIPDQEHVLDLEPVPDPEQVSDPESNLGPLFSAIYLKSFFFLTKVL